MKMTFDHEPLPLNTFMSTLQKGSNYKNKLKTNQKHIIDFLMINYHVQVFTLTSGASVMQFELPPLGLLIPTQTFL